MKWNDINTIISFLSAIKIMAKRPNENNNHGKRRIKNADLSPLRFLYAWSWIMDRVCVCVWIACERVWVLKFCWKKMEWCIKKISMHCTGFPVSLISRRWWVIKYWILFFFCFTFGISRNIEMLFCCCFVLIFVLASLSNYACVSFFIFSSFLDKKWISLMMPMLMHHNCVCVFFFFSYLLSIKMLKFQLLCLCKRNRKRLLLLIGNWSRSQPIWLLQKTNLNFIAWKLATSVPPVTNSNKQPNKYY